MGRLARRRRTYRKIGPRWENPIHYQHALKLTYRDNGFTALTALGQTFRVFRGNGPYDPDYTGVGVQPYGFDEMSALYNNYIVKGSKIKVTAAIQPIENFPGTEATCIIVPERYNTVLVNHDLADLRAYGRYRSKIFARQQGLTNKNVIRSYASTKSVYATVSSSDDKMEANFSSLPALPWYWLVYFDTTTFGREVQIYYDVEITYYMTCMREKSINES